MWDHLPVILSPQVPPVLLSIPSIAFIPDFRPQLCTSSHNVSVVIFIDTALLGFHSWSGLINTIFSSLLDGADAFVSSVPTIPDILLALSIPSLFSTIWKHTFLFSLLQFWWVCVDLKCQFCFSPQMLYVPLTAPFSSVIQWCRSKSSQPFLAQPLWSTSV